MEDNVLKSKDWRIVIGLFTIYLCLALVHLGNLHAPEHVWQGNTYGKTVTADFGAVSQIGRINVYGGAGMGEYTLETSTDGHSWHVLQRVNHDHVFAFAWTTLSIPNETAARYLKLTVTQPGAAIIEMGVFTPTKQLLQVKSIQGPQGNALFDEQAMVPWTKTFMNSTYFDEIYHARTAYEFLHQLEPYETTHPPLGKDIQAIGIWLFGMNPFGWRIMGTVTGALLIPVLYLFTKLLTRETKWAFVASLFMAVDMMHFAQSRMGTVDTYIVLFVMLAFLFMVQFMQKQRWYWLCLSGIGFGMASAVKWNGMYAGIGLAILFCISIVNRYRNERNKRTIGVMLGAGVIFFILIPILIYGLSYMPFLHATKAADGWKEIWTYQKDMYDYHSQLKATHPFSSKWYEWPFIKRPLWLYSGSDLPYYKVSTLVDIGNPITWWAGLFACIWALFIGYKREEIRVVLIAIFSLYVPWMVSPRSLTFIYHFFPILPFWLLLVVFVLRDMTEQNRKLGTVLTWVICGLATICFVAFYPAISGLEVSRTYATAIWSWFSTWQFF
jgi:dolichyl-phosphate-mannose--protein O-mannosyl transferase